MAKKIAFLVFAIALLPGCIYEQESKGFAIAEKALVLRATDGDTLLLENRERVRLIGINAPEKGQKCFEEAKNRLQDIVSGRNVLLVKDVSERDKYGRLVRYVYLNDLFVNLALVEEGLAFSYEFEPDTKFKEMLNEAEATAMKNNGCLWQE